MGRYMKWESIYLLNEEHSFDFKILKFEFKQDNQLNR